MKDAQFGNVFIVYGNAPKNKTKNDEGNGCFYVVFWHCECGIFTTFCM